MFCDAHFHLVQSLLSQKKDSCTLEDSVLLENLFSPFKSDNKIEYLACTCAHDVDEYSKQKELLNFIKEKSDNEFQILNSFGLHPQNPCIENISFLEMLLQKNELDAIGESGFDLFTDEFSANIEKQIKAWKIQCEFAKKYQKTLIVHCRKAMNLIFADFAELKKIPVVIFHSFAGSPVEAQSLLKRGINAYFSFGKPILNNNKRAIACVSLLPIERILLETDAPFQTLKAEEFTHIEQIQNVYNQAYKLRFSAELDSIKSYKEDNFAFDEFTNQIQKNFLKAYCKKS